MLFFWGCLIFSLACSKNLKVNDGSIGVPVTYYPGQSETVQVDEDQCYEIHQCAGGMGGFSQAQLVIDLPNNPSWDLNRGYILAEISKCKGSFDSSCILYTNYIWNNGLNIIAYNNITWSTTNSYNDLYLRVTTVQAPADFTFQITYGNYGYLVNGEFDYDVFNSASSCSVSNQVHQYAMPSAIVSVDNYEMMYYTLQFCQNNSFPTNTWTANINVAATFEKPKSAFEIVACSADMGISNCKLSHYDEKNGDAVAVVSLAITNSNAVPINDGMIIGVYGIGAELDLNNQGILTITVANS